VAAVALAFHAAVPVVALLFVARIVLGAGMAGASPCAFGLAAAEIPVERRGSGIGVVFSARTLALALSAMCGGWLSQWIGIRGLFLCGAVTVGLALVRLARTRTE
jgi:MFS family permease